MMRSRRVGVTATILACILLLFISFTFLFSYLSPGEPVREEHEFLLGPGAVEGRFVPSHSLGDVLEISYRVTGGDGSGITVTLGNRTVFGEWSGDMMAGSPWDKDDALGDGGMLFVLEGPEGEGSLKLPGETLILGIHNAGAVFVTVTVAVEVGGEPQYICLCFFIPTLIIIMAAAWMALKGGSLKDEKGRGVERGHYPHRGYGPNGTGGRGPPAGDDRYPYPPPPASAPPPLASAPPPPARATPPPPEMFGATLPLWGDGPTPSSLPVCGRCGRELSPEDGGRGLCAGCQRARKRGRQKGGPGRGSGRGSGRGPERRP